MKELSVKRVLETSGERPAPTEKASYSQQQEHLDRLRAMVQDRGQTWDLSDNDQTAISSVLAELGRVCVLNAEMLAALETALDELHEVNLVSPRHPRSPELTIAAEATVRAVIQKAKGGQ